MNDSDRQSSRMTGVRRTGCSRGLKLLAAKALRIAARARFELSVMHLVRRGTEFSRPGEGAIGYVLLWQESRVLWTFPIIGAIALLVPLSKRTTCRPQGLR